MNLSDFIKQYYSLVNSICTRVLKNYPQDAEECVNETFYKLWTKHNMLKEEKNIKAYICVTAKNTAINRLKQLKKINSTEIEITYISDESDIILDFENKENARVLQKIILQLKEPNREIFVRKYWFFENNSEIALRFGFTQKQIENSLYNSKQILKKLLKLEGFE